ncbi:calcium-binding protein [Streptomyces sp. NPDC006458]|uniref:calcium-binding protein n=1 Tax=Streptomyces sp. NPDC006458 TaxID=3154302 RepID=UPI0033A6465A
MATRATIAAVSGALVLSALTVPVAQAVSGDSARIDRPGAAERFKAGAARSAGVSAAEAPTVSNVTVNGGKGVVVGSKSAKTFTVSLTASHPSGIQEVYIDLWHGSDPETGLDGWLPPNDDLTCTAASATTSNCKMTITATPGDNSEDGIGDLYANALAGTWHVGVGALANDQSEYWDDYYTTHRVQRNAVLTMNAAPEPVAKGKTLSVKGTFTRADWQTGTYSKYTNQYMQLQFKKSGSTAYTKVKTVKSSTTGAVSSTATATYDGTWRFYFSGASTTTSPLTVSPGDFVDVR